MGDEIRHYFYWVQFTLLTVLIGAAAGLAATFFCDLIAFFHNLLFHGKISLTYDFFQHAAPSRWGIGVILVPVVGGVLVAFLVKHFAPEAKGDGVPEVLDAIHYNKGVMRPIVSVVKAFASAISIGSGGSVGREGPIIQIGAALGSAVGKWVKVEHPEKITLIGCGASAALAATFNTPIAGVFFAIEIMLLELKATTIVPITIATVSGTYVSYIFFGNVPFIPTLPTIFTHTSFNFLSLINCIPLGIVIGLTSAIFIYSIHWAENLFERLPRSHYSRHMLGMLFVGISMYIMLNHFGHYYIQGVGYATAFDVLAGQLSDPSFLIFLVFFKILNTAITLGSGGSGGIFSPALFIGAALGGGLKDICNSFGGDDAVLGVQFYALAGMAGMVASSTGALITAVIMIAEMTNNLLIILPLMVVVAISYTVRLLITADSIYTLKLTQQGHVIPAR